jgi:hypothetical protein
MRGTFSIAIYAKSLIHVYVNLNLFLVKEISQAGEIAL